MNVAVEPLILINLDKRKHAFLTFVRGSVGMLF